MISVSEEKIKAIGGVLNDQTRPLKERFRALFTLKNIGGKTSIDCINECFSDPSALLKHELAYCLGQMQDAHALPILVSVLDNELQEDIVRHEAAEAIGAIGTLEDAKLKELLLKYKDDPVVEVAETCQLALQRMEWFESHPKERVSPFNSVDPTPPSTTTDVAQLRQVLLDDNETLFNRYRAMFALRNINNEESILALCEGLNSGGSLFRHEVAFVLGQLAEPRSVPALTEALEDLSQHEMVRHECAEALGAVASEDCLGVLRKYLSDDKRVVRESCEIALDMCEYENSPEFQYADTLLKV
ncbi:deoxyhypusine hydroxylase-like [Homalodisca vitripennis]|uniref:deoxyhypusine hydroxylase-like n=1 Tax=Homalodisca vitripennis TaxID=197043 RepID=UPI001EEC974B|nr:deoxyhypusine hydroxylase-like [Homalodisca vitripennis]